MISFRPGTAVHSTYEGGFLGIAVDLDGEQEAGAPILETFHPYGFLSRPVDPVTDEDGLPTSGCQVFYGWEGSRGFALPTLDPRSALTLPELAPGETLFYGPTGQFIRCKSDGSIMMMTTDDATTDGRSIYFEMSKEKGFEISCPWGRFSLGPLGVHLIHSSGAQLHMGAIAGLPAPLDTLGSYAEIEAAMMSVSGGAISLGTDGGLGNETAVLSLQTTMLALQATLTALGALVASLLPSSGATDAQKTAYASALATFTTAQAAFTLIAPAIGKVV